MNLEKRCRVALHNLGITNSDVQTEILLAAESNVDLSVLIRGNWNAKQIYQIRLALEEGSNVCALLHQELSDSDMQSIREREILAMNSGGGYYNEGCRATY
jgi:hypothetical protein